MKIVVMTELFWPQGSGAELTTYLLLKRLVQRGFEVIVLTNSDVELPTKRTL